MKKTFGLLVGITAIAIVGLVVYRRRSRDMGHMLRRVSDEGYETAPDVLFPNGSRRGRDLRYGPVIPR